MPRTMSSLTQTTESIVNKYVSFTKYVVLFSGFLLHVAYGSVLTFGKSKLLTLGQFGIIPSLKVT